MQQTTHRIEEISRRAAPAGRPQPLALYEGRLWFGSWETGHIYGMDPQRWSAAEDVAAPGTPYGLAPHNGALHVVVSDGGEADDRYLYRFVPGRGFLTESKTPCPQLTGSHLASDGKQLYLGQMHERRILRLDEGANPVEAFALPTRCAGFGFGAEGLLYMIAADEEFEELTFGKLDLTAEPRFDPIARFPFGARALVFDGSAWYTCDREAGEIVAFRVAD